MMWIMTKWSNLKTGGNGLVGSSKTYPTIGEAYEEPKYTKTKSVHITYAGTKVLMRNGKREEEPDCDN